MDFVLRLAAGRYKESPFGEDELREARMAFSQFAGAEEVAAVGSYSPGGAMNYPSATVSSSATILSMRF
jgi:hypothetical protein